MSKTAKIRIGGASGYWGESDMGLAQLLAAGDLDYVVFDYLAEITLSIMARARDADPAKGYATDFVTAAMKPHLREIAERGVKVLSNAGGVNPQACAASVRALIAEQGLDLRVAVVLGDDLLGRAAEFAAARPREMFGGLEFPPLESIASINAYLGAFPVAEALDRGADIVITGRCVDSAVTLGACIHAFGWGRGDLDRLAGGSLAGHLLECGPQVTGGNFTDWESVAETLGDVGYPIAEIAENGACVMTKPEGTGGVVSVGTVGEQMLYEIGDPRAYLLPDVVCDFSTVALEQVGADRVRASGAVGRAAPDSYKVSLTWQDGWRLASMWFFIGDHAERKARSFAETALRRARRKLTALGLPDYDEVAIEPLGNENHYGAFARVSESREVAVKIAVKHRERDGAALLLKEATGLGLAAPPGLAMFAGGRPKPSPIVRLFSFLVPKSEVPVSVAVDESVVELGVEPAAVCAVADAAASPATLDPASAGEPAPPPALSESELVEVPLVRLAWGRAGDKGDKSNIGILPRKPEYTPWIWAALSEDEVARRFAHFLQGAVERFHLPGTGAINFLLHDALGGGGIASLRNDPQGKCYAQILLQTPIPIPRALVEKG